VGHVLYLSGRSVLDQILEQYMREVSTSEARRRWHALLKEVEHGGEVMITRNGKRVAKLVRVQENKSPGHDIDRARAAAEAILAMRKNNTLGGITFRELIDEGRRR